MSKINSFLVPTKKLTPASLVSSIINCCNNNNDIIEKILPYCTQSIRNTTRWWGMKDWNNIIKSIIEDHYEETNDTVFKKHKSETNIGFHNSNRICCLLKDSYVGKWKDEYIHIEFQKMYPNIILKLSDSGNMVFNNSIFPDVYKTILEARNTIIHMDEKAFRGFIKCYADIKMDGAYNRYDDSGTRLVNIQGIIVSLLKILTNFAYGAMGNKDSIINTDDIGKVVDYYCDTFNKIFDKYDTVAYIDTDEIFVDGDSQLSLIEEDLKKLDLPYNINKYFEGRFDGKKNCILYSDTIRLSRGKNKTLNKILAKNTVSNVDVPSHKDIGAGDYFKCGLTGKVRKCVYEFSDMRLGKNETSVDDIKDDDTKLSNEKVKKHLKKLRASTGNSKNLLYDELLLLPVDLYNEVVYKVYKNKHPDGEMDICKYCNRFVQGMSCICPDGEKDLYDMLKEVSIISNRA